jgi:PTS system mannose-specific IIB component
MIALVRIDDRLIHGQVVEAWLPALAARRVLVLSDAAAADETQAQIMAMALPDSVSLEIVAEKDGAAAFQRAAQDPEKVLVLAAGPAEILALARAGAAIRSVNVGGLHHAAGRVQLGRAIFIDDRDAAALRELSERGITLEGRAVPSEKPSDVAALVRAVNA